MDRVEKTLRTLPKAERIRYRRMTEDVIADRLARYDVVKLVGRDDVFRIRKGPMRVIFRRHRSGNSILALERRSETTYRKR